MINLGISSARQRKFNEALCGHRQIKVTVQFLDLEHRYISTVSNRLIDGQVNIDATASITRSATLSLLDPERTLGLDSDNPADGQAYLDRMVRIIYSVWVVDDWVDVPVFVGPIVRIQRSEDTVEIEAQGKEHLAQRPSFKTRTWKKGLTRIGVIRGVMEELTGEDRFLLPTSWPAKTAENVVVNPKYQPWSYVIKLTNSMKAKVFYDGRGNLRVRKNPTRVAWTFRDGDGGSILTQPEVSYSGDEITNTVQISGGIPKGAKKKVTAKAFIPRWHPLSPHRLGRNGAPRYLPESIEDDTIKSTKDAEKAANRRIKEIMVETAEVTFDSLVIPHLEENDLVRAEYNGQSVSFRLTKMTIALSHSGVSSIGYLRKVSRNTKRIRRNR